MLDKVGKLSFMNKAIVMYSAMISFRLKISGIISFGSMYNDSSGIIIKVGARQSDRVVLLFRLM